MWYSSILRLPRHQHHPPPPCRGELVLPEPATKMFQDLTFSKRPRDFGEPAQETLWVYSFMIFQRWQRQILDQNLREPGVRLVFINHLLSEAATLSRSLLNQKYYLCIYVCIYVCNVM